MQITRKDETPTRVKLTVEADQAQLNAIKLEVLTRLRPSVKTAGFRAGKTPLNLVEKNVDPNVLQTEFLEHAINHLYTEAIRDEKLRPVVQPEVNVLKFVPFTTLEFEGEVEVVGAVTLPDYKKIKLSKTPVKVDAKDIDDVLATLRTRAATKLDVTRAAKSGDEATIDFTGTDAKTGEPIDGADGKDYPLIIGSNAFIPGFEPALIGLKAGQEKTFIVTFPSDYGAATLRNREVKFKVAVSAVKELTEPKLDDAFAATVGPFKTLDELKADIKKSLNNERQTQADRDYESQLLEMIANKSKVAIPTTLVDEEINRHDADERQNLVYRGQTWEEHLKAEGVTEEEHREKQRPASELRVKAGIILGDIAQAENIIVSPDELEIRMQLLKGQYTDPSMQAELEKPETRRDMASRLVTEKTIAKLTSYATAK